MMPVETQNDAYRLSRPLGEIMQQRALDLDERRKDPEKYRPIPTSIPKLNEIILGFPVEQPFYMLLFSSEKIGKSTVGMDFAESWRKGSRTPVMYAQLEELGMQYADRTLAGMTSLKRSDIRMFNINDEQMQEIYAASLEVLQNSNAIYIQDDLFSIYSLIQEAKRINCKNIVLDNLQLIDQDGFKGSSAQERFAAISRYLVKLRNQGGYSFVVISQMGQEGRAFGSGQANRDADILIQIEHVYETDADDEERVVEGLRCLNVHPGRIGGIGKCQVAFDGNKSRIAPVITVDINSNEFLAILEKEGPAPTLIM